MREVCRVHMILLMKWVWFFSTRESMKRSWFLFCVQVYPIAWEVMIDYVYFNGKRTTSFQYFVPIQLFALIDTVSFFILIIPNSSHIFSFQGSSLIGQERGGGSADRTASQLWDGLGQLGVTNISDYDHDPFNRINTSESVPELQPDRWGAPFPIHY
jgi:hypothetical protein